MKNPKSVMDSYLNPSVYDTEKNICKLYAKNDLLNDKVTLPVA